MKITIFYSSIHKTRGNTHIIIDQFAQGARTADAEVDIVLLAEKKIKPCMACMHCWTKTPGKCAISDDMALLLEQFMASDIVVMATPVYIHNVSGIMKTFLDRMLPILDPRLEKLENGATGHIQKHEAYPKFGLIVTGGFPEQSCCDFVRRYFQLLAAELHSEVLFEICKGEAILLKMDETTPVGPIVEAYKKNVRQAGREIVENLRISEKTAKELNQPFIPEEIYIAEANKYWDSRMAHYAEDKVL